uniref:Ycf80 n=1 Tax=Ahnfeltia plicata TaxID=28023 RepID=A0A1C9CB02_9FLOR|nr:hypothetical protein Ahnf_071 [Ahnfeltia plicata]AOM65556.1 hypothetical protein Ahnf_071 [Ahnfeltia plicata]UAT97337.1 hypothetical protein Ahn.pli.Chile.pt_010 [Ahnfeltia plicata]
MSLFNLMFMQWISDYSDRFISEVNTCDYKKIKSFDSNFRATINPVLLISAKTKVNSREKTVENFSDKKYMTNNLIKELIHKYWQQTIFLSIPNSSSENYSNKLRSDSISPDKSKQKKFLADFSKALVIGRIEASVIKDISSKTKNSYIKYVWRKGVNLPSPNNWSGIFENKRYSSFPSKMQVNLMQKLKANQFPVFTLVNGFNQIIVTEPSEELLINENLLDKFYKWYHDNFLWQKDYKPVYEGLFFVNPSDAEEYQEYTASKYINSSRQYNLNLFASGLDVYYRMVRTSPPRVQFRLIPDLKEVGRLVRKYRNKKNITFHHKQKYGRNYFQGQPIYLIQPVLSRSKASNITQLVKYTYKIGRSNNEIESDTVFTNYDTAVLAWQKFRHEHSEYKLPSVPKLMVYNLEDLLSRDESDISISQKNYFFVPAQESYYFMTNNEIKQSKISKSSYLNHKMLYAKVWAKRILWSLTSRQPINW